MKSLILSLSIIFIANTSFASTINDMIRNQSPVKSQGTIGSCSMFSAIALLEYKLRKYGYTENGKHADISEQYLLYTAAGQKGKVGVTSKENVKALNEFGFVTESHWPFGTSPWYKIKNYQSLPKLAKKRCGHLQGSGLFQSCLVGQRDPQLLLASDEVLLDKSSSLYDPDFKKLRDFAETTNNDFKFAQRRIRNKNEIIRLLKSGEPLLMDVTVFFQAWNRILAAKQGMKRDMNMFHKGIVSFPPKKSADYRHYKSQKVKRGHSVLVVGYDPLVKIQRQVEGQKPGTMIDASTNGVFYFKNGWGTKGFGKDFVLNGERFPGYGMISMKYALRNGRFFKMTVNGK